MARLVHNPFTRFRRLQRQYRARFKMTLGAWLHYHQNTIVFDQSSWMGIPAQKNPLDAWIYQEIIAEVRPEVIIEIGSNAGGSTLFLAHLLDALGHGIVISLDIDRSQYRAEHDRIVTVTGDSLSPEIVAHIHDLCAGKRVLIIHDGDHVAPHVLQDLNAYADLVPVGSYLIVEDGIVDVTTIGGSYIKPGEGPLVATERFLAAHPEFALDERRERYLLSYNPRGFLRRIR